MKPYQIKLTLVSVTERWKTPRKIVNLDYTQREIGKTRCKEKTETVDSDLKTNIYCVSGDRIRENILHTITCFFFQYHWYTQNSFHFHFRIHVALCLFGRLQ